MNSEDNRQLVPLRELIATTLEAAIEADMAALRCYYDNLCELALIAMMQRNRQFLVLGIFHSPMLMAMGSSIK